MQKASDAPVVFLFLAISQLPTIHPSTAAGHNFRSGSSGNQPTRWHPRTLRLVTPTLCKCYATSAPATLHRTPRVDCLRSPSRLRAGAGPAINDAAPGADNGALPLRLHMLWMAAAGMPTILYNIPDGKRWKAASRWDNAGAMSARILLSGVRTDRGVHRS